MFYEEEILFIELFTRRPPCQARLRTEQINIRSFIVITRSAA